MRDPLKIGILTAACVGLLALPLAKNLSAGDAPKGQKIEGKLAEGDDPDKITQGPSKKHTIQLKMGKLYSLILKSEDFDCFLRLEDSEGNQVAFDDDSAGNLDSLIRYVPKKDGAFNLIASSLDKKPGSYLLLIQESEAPKLAAAKAVPKDGLKLEDKLTAEDPGDLILRKSPSKRLAVKLQGAQPYRIDMDSDDFDCVLRLEDENGKQVGLNDDRAENNLNSTIIYTPAADGTYVIIATNLDGKRGAFTLRVAPN